MIHNFKIKDSEIGCSVKVFLTPSTIARSVHESPTDLQSLSKGTCHIYWMTVGLKGFHGTDKIYFWKEKTVMETQDVKEYLHYSWYCHESLL